MVAGDDERRRCDREDHCAAAELDALQRLRREHEHHGEIGVLNDDRAGLDHRDVTPGLLLRGGDGCAQDVVVRPAHLGERRRGEDRTVLVRQDHPEVGRHRHDVRQPIGRAVRLRVQRADARGVQSDDPCRCRSHASSLRKGVCTETPPEDRRRPEAVDKGPA